MRIFNLIIHVSRNIRRFNFVRLVSFISMTSIFIIIYNQSSIDKQRLLANKLNFSKYYIRIHFKYVPLSLVNYSALNFYDYPKNFTIRQYRYASNNLEDCVTKLKYSSNASESKVFKGGVWSPMCKSIHKVAILVPYRDRKSNLVKFLRRIHSFLQFQNLDYGIYVIEQKDEEPFNRGKLLNIGYVFATTIYPYNCLIIHDVDKLPDNDAIEYNCNQSPTLLIKSSRKENSKKIVNAQIYPTYFGGVVAIKPIEYFKANGMINHFWGWGAEDDDFYNRLVIKSLNPKQINLKYYKFLILHHRKDAQNSYRIFPTLNTSYLQMKFNGLNNLRFKLVDIIYKDSYTLIKVLL